MIQKKSEKKNTERGREREKGKGDKIFFSCIKRNISILDSVLALVKRILSQEIHQRGNSGRIVRGKIKILPSG